jgi:hypothetical protein
MRAFSVLIERDTETAQNAERSRFTADGKNACASALHIAVANQLRGGALWNIRLEHAKRFRFIKILRESLYTDDW